MNLEFLSTALAVTDPPMNTPNQAHNMMAAVAQALPHLKPRVSSALLLASVPTGSRGSTVQPSPTAVVSIIVNCRDVHQALARVAQLFCQFKKLCEKMAPRWLKQSALMLASRPRVRVLRT